MILWSNLATVLSPYADCRDIERNALGLKCKSFKKKYTIVFLEAKDKITVCEFLSTKLIR